MIIEVKWKDDVPLFMAMDLINNMTEAAKLFGTIHSVVVRFKDGEEEQMIDVENNRVPRIE